MQDQSQRRSTIIAPAVWLAEFLSDVNEHFAEKRLARSEFYSTALSDALDIVWEYHRWRQAMVRAVREQCLGPPAVTYVQSRLRWTGFYMRLREVQGPHLNPPWCEMSCSASFTCAYASA